MCQLGSPQVKKGKQKHQLSVVLYGVAAWLLKMCLLFWHIGFETTLHEKLICYGYVLLLV